MSLYKYLYNLSVLDSLLFFSSETIIYLFMYIKNSYNKWNILSIMYSGYVL